MLVLQCTAPALQLGFELCSNPPPISTSSPLRPTPTPCAQAGMQVFPNQPMLLILYANFLMEVRMDGPASRTQLQIASKHTPTMVERYQIFCTVENSKRLKDSQEGGMDLQAYVEFKRNYRYEGLAIHAGVGRALNGRRQVCDCRATALCSPTKAG